MVSKIGHQLCTRDTFSCEKERNAQEGIGTFHNVQSRRDLQRIFLMLQMWAGTVSHTEQEMDRIF